MELESLRKLLIELKEKGIKVSTVVTDRSISVRYFFIYDLNTSISLSYESLWYTLVGIWLTGDSDQLIKLCYLDWVICSLLGKCWKMISLIFNISLTDGEIEYLPLPIIFQGSWTNLHYKLGFASDQLNFVQLPSIWIYFV